MKTKCYLLENADLFILLESHVLLFFLLSIAAWKSVWGLLEFRKKNDVLKYWNEGGSSHHYKENSPGLSVDVK